MDFPNIPLDGPPLSPVLTGQQVCFAFDNTYARLPEHFYARLGPTPVAAPRIVKVNVELARELGLDADALASEHGVAILAGNRVADGAEPIALAYAGHQFGHFVPTSSASWYRATANATTSSSRALAEPLSRAAATAELHLDRCCESTLSARPWRRWAYPPRGPWLP
jgi:hypothetical protein